MSYNYKSFSAWKNGEIWSNLELLQIGPMVRFLLKNEKLQVDFMGSASNSDIIRKVWMYKSVVKIDANFYRGRISNFMQNF